jgi:hypothetical protein
LCYRVSDCYIIFYVGLYRTGKCFTNNRTWLTGIITDIFERYIVITFQHLPLLKNNKNISLIPILYINPFKQPTKVVSSNPVHGEMFSIQHYVIKFVCDLQQVCDFLQVLWFPPPIKLTATI